MTRRRRRGVDRRAQAMRESSTLAERHLWSRLSGKQLGATFIRQGRIGGRYVSFLALSKKVAIEIDGGRTSGSLRITSGVASEFRVLFFYEMDVLSRTDAVIDAIADALRQPRRKKENTSPEPEWPELG
jgi:very-short-patch-repair endonuclease